MGTQRHTHMYTKTHTHTDTHRHRQIHTDTYRYGAELPYCLLLGAGVGSSEPGSTNKAQTRQEPRSVSGTSTEPMSSVHLGRPKPGLLHRTSRQKPPGETVEMVTTAPAGRGCTLPWRCERAHLLGR